MAFWKADLLKVNGYNEAIVGWGRDSELAIRLVNAGIKKRIIKFAAITFHIYHPEIARTHLLVNDGILNRTLKDAIKSCDLGISHTFKINIKTSFMDKVSILIVTYNAAQDLQNCLDSIKNKHTPPLEVVVVDGLSQDGTVDILKIVI
ncbi:hypothetical protein CS542_04195 [Pedobacter sp. IW39]|nr:hypothetical protein CS542_04195 [Pedobacter sp. IW39]